MVIVAWDGTEVLSIAFHRFLAEVSQPKSFVDMPPTVNPATLNETAEVE